MRYALTISTRVIQVATEKVPFEHLRFRNGDLPRKGLVDEVAALFDGQTMPETDKLLLSRAKAYE
jgi:hypothetical protein